MRTLARLASTAALLAASALHAQTLAPAYTYSGLFWSVSTSQSGFAPCTQLFLDATGDVYNSDNFVLAGQLYCPSLGGSYSSSGNAYFDAFGNFNMTIELGVAHKLVCTNLPGGSLSGSCPIYNNTGTQTGTAFVSF